MRKLLPVFVALLAACLPTPESPAPTPTASPAPTATPSATSTPVATPTIQASGRLTLDGENSRIYRYPPNSFVRPLALVSSEDAAFLLDGGRLLRADLSSGSLTQVPYPPGGIEGVPVKGLSDLAMLQGGSLILLDRSGDVYRWDPKTLGWTLERRATIASASPRQHLTAAVAWGDEFYLLDINMDLVWRHSGGEATVVLRHGLLHESVDLAADGGFFVIPGGAESHTVIRLDANGAVDSSFSAPEMGGDLRLLEVDPEGLLYVGEAESGRIWGLDRETGAMVREIELTDPGAEALGLSARGGRLFVASRDTLYIYPGRSEEGDPLSRVAPLAAPLHDPALLDRLPVLVPPVEGTVLTDISFRLPGAPRRYRYGVHEGTDFFWSGAGPVVRGTPVLAVANGTVVRADLDYQEPSAAEMQGFLDTSRARGYTPPEILDRLRGRQVHLELGGGAVIYYSHLSGIADGIVPGASVQPGQILGFVGNSGTPEAQISPDVGVHLHLEIRMGDGYFGQHLRHPEVRDWYLRIFGWA